MFSLRTPLILIRSRCVRTRALPRMNRHTLEQTSHDDQAASAAVPSTSTHHDKPAPKRTVYRDLYPSKSEEKRLYKESPILQPTESVVSADDELSEGAKLWFANLVDKSEKEDIDLNESLSPYADSEASFAQTDGAVLPPPEEIFEGQVYKLPKPVDAPKRVPRKMMRTYTFATLVNENEQLQKLVDLGVDLSELELKHNAAEVLLRAHWEEDILPRMEFLMKIGLELGQLGGYLSKNPWILQQGLDDLEMRVEYLVSKAFTQGDIAKIVEKAVFWLNFNVITIDTRLGWLQKEFRLTGDEVRHVIVTAPKLITFGLGYMQLLEVVFHKEFGFTALECKQLLVKDPKLWLRNRQSLTVTFDYLHRTLHFPHALLVTFPTAMRYSRYYVEQRHRFLEHLGRAQYDPVKPGYVSLQMLLTGKDSVFCAEVARRPVKEYNQFLKTI